MRRRTQIMAVAGILLGWGQAAVADTGDLPYDIDVSCEGNPTHDVPAVQQAVDAGIGQPSWTVLIRGECHFGYDRNGFWVDPIGCDVDDDCPAGPPSSVTWCQPLPGAPGGKAGVCLRDGILANGNPFKRGESTVYVTSSTTIVGEMDEHGNYLTTIFGGRPPFWVGWDGGIDGGLGALFGGAPSHWDGASFGLDFTERHGTRWCRAYPDIDVTIGYLHFDHPQGFGAAAVGAAHDFTFEGNWVTDAQSDLYDPWYKPGPVGRGSGVTIGGGLQAPFLDLYRADPEQGAFYDAAQPTGDVIVRDNLIQRVAVDATRTQPWQLAGVGHEPLGIIVFDSNARIQIVSNDVIDVGLYGGAKGIAVLDNLGEFTLITNNLVHNVILWGIVDWVSLIPSNHAVITHNTVSNCGGGGIEARNSSEGVFRNNAVHLSEDTGDNRCIYLNNAHDVHARANRCTGVAHWGVYLRNSDENTFVGNDLNGLTTTEADTCLLSSDDNTFIGNAGSVCQQDSSGNVVTAGSILVSEECEDGYEPVAGGVEPDATTWRDAIQAMQEAGVWGGP